MPWEGRDSTGQLLLPTSTSTPAMLNTSALLLSRAKSPNTIRKVTGIAAGTTGTHTYTGLEPGPVAPILPSNTTRPQAESAGKQRLEHGTGTHTACEVAGETQTRPASRLFKAGPARAAGPHPRDPHPALRRSAASPGIPRLCGNDASPRRRQRQGYVRQLPPQRSFYRSIINPGRRAPLPLPQAGGQDGGGAPRGGRREAGRGRRGAARPAATPARLRRPLPRRAAGSARPGITSRRGDVGGLWRSRASAPIRINAPAAPAPPPLQWRGRSAPCRRPPRQPRGGRRRRARLGVERFSDWNLCPPGMVWVGTQLNDHLCSRYGHRIPFSRSSWLKPHPGWPRRCLGWGTRSLSGQPVPASAPPECWRH